MSKTVVVEVTIVRHTDRALLVKQGTSEVWLPKSQILEPGADWVDKLKPGEETELEIPAWLAGEKELEF